MNKDKFFQQLAKESALIIRFCSKYKKIILYGAGNYSYTMFKFLEKNGIVVSGFIVSKKKANNFEGRPLYEVSERSFFKEETGIILALGSSMHEDVLKQLDNNAFSRENIYIPTDMFYRFHTGRNRISIEKVEYFKNTFPAKKYTTDDFWNNILVVCNDGIGDLILTTPFLRELRNCYKNSSISLVVTKECKSLFELCPYINQLYICSARGNMYIEDKVDQCAKDFAQRYFRNKHYDVVFLPGSYVWCAINTYLAMYSRSPLRIAHKVYGESLGDDFCNHRIDELYSLQISDNNICHEVERRLDLLTSLGKHIGSKKIELWTNQEDDLFARQIQNEYKILGSDILVAIVPIASSATRSWNPNKMAALMLRLLNKYNDMRFIVLGGNNTAAVAEIFSEKVPTDKMINMVGRTTLRQAIALMRFCKLYIGMNTGLIHVAAACNVPVVEISPHSLEGNPAHDNSPLRYRAWGVPDIVIQPKHPSDECQDFCIRKSAHCINQVTVEEVEKKVDLMISKCRIEKEKQWK